MRIALKDSMAIAGIPLTLGSAVMDGFVPEADAVVVERVLAAGAEIVAITNMDDFAFSGGGDSSAYGPTRNPFDRSRTAAGSSGGSAAALYYEGIDAALGTDQGGSIRAPAAWCGVLGHKPTHALVPYTGIAGIDATFDHVGPMTRSVEDAARPARRHRGGGPVGPAPGRRGGGEDYGRAVAEAPDDLAGLRIGLVAEGTARRSARARGRRGHARASPRGCASSGAEVRDVSLPEHATAGAVAFAGFIEGMTALLGGGGNGYHWRGRYAPGFADALALALRERADRLSPQIKVTLIVGEHLRRTRRGAVYARAQNARPALVAAHDRALAEVDLLLMPTTPRAAARPRPRHAAARPPHARLGPARQHVARPT